jgi:hypothetical protein
LFGIWMAQPGFPQSFVTGLAYYGNIKLDKARDQVSELACEWS